MVRIPRDYSIVDILEVLFMAGSALAGKAFGRDTAYSSLRDSYGVTYSKTHFSKHYYELKRCGYIREAGLSIEFTSKTKLKLLEKQLPSLGADGYYRFISFDIPETLRHERDMFRRAIKRIGFRQIQKSLWVINKDASEFVELAAYEFGVEKYVVYIASQISDIDGVIGKMFDR